jgi:Uncharacterized protein family UPF0016
VQEKEAKRAAARGGNGRKDHPGASDTLASLVRRHRHACRRAWHRIQHAQSTGRHDRTTALLCAYIMVKLASWKAGPWLMLRTVSTLCCLLARAAVAGVRGGLRAHLPGGVGRPQPDRHHRYGTGSWGLRPAVHPECCCVTVLPFFVLVHWRAIRVSSCLYLSHVYFAGLAASIDIVGVTLGGILGHSICTGAAVLGGRQLATHIQERTVHVSHFPSRPG